MYHKIVTDLVDHSGLLDLSSMWNFIQAPNSPSKWELPSLCCRKWLQILWAIGHDQKMCSESSAPISQFEHPGFDVKPLFCLLVLCSRLSCATSHRNVLICSRALSLQTVFQNWFELLVSSCLRIHSTDLMVNLPELVPPQKLRSLSSVVVSSKGAIRSMISSGR